MKKNSSSSAIRRKRSTRSRQSSNKGALSIPKLQLQKDLADFVALSLLRKVKFLIVGGYAMALHGAPRFTKDIDLFIESSRENAIRMEGVLREFGISEEEVRLEDIFKPGYVIQIGRPPNRVDVLTSISGVDWSEAWDSRVEVNLSGHKCLMIGKDLLIRNKRASGRPQDLVDADKLLSGTP